MGLFQRQIQQKPNQKTNQRGKTSAADDLPEFVDGLLDAAQLDDVAESQPLIVHPVEYGIDKAIQLLQKLPQDNTSLVVSVVRETLESANIDVDVVVEDALTKAENMQECIDALSSDIARLKTQIAQKEAEIVQTKAALQETQRVQELLQSSTQPDKAASVVTLKTPQSAKG